MRISQLRLVFVFLALLPSACTLRQSEIYAVNSTPPKLPPPGSVIWDAATAIRLALDVCKPAPGAKGAFGDLLTRYEASLSKPWEAHVVWADEHTPVNPIWFVTGGFTGSDTCAEFTLRINPADGIPYEGCHECYISI